MSLKARLLVAMSVVAIVLVATGILVVTSTQSDLVDRVDAQLTGALPTVRTFGADRRGIVIQPDAELSSLYVGLIEDSSVRTLVRPTFGGSAEAVPDVPVRRAIRTAGVRAAKPFTVPAESGGTRYRLLAVALVGGDTLVLGLSLHDVDASVSRLQTEVIVATLAVLVILAVVVLWVIRLGVRPVKQMTQTAVAIAGGDLSQRVPKGRRGTEAEELGTALNSMLGTIEGAFAERSASEERLRRFVADASHELRTPVTTIRGYAELYRRGGLREPGALDQAMRRTEQEAIRMGSLVEDLIVLARLDERRPRASEPVDLGVVAVDAVADARVVAPDRVMRAQVGRDVIVQGDEGQLRQVVANLVGNTLVHTVPGTRVDVRVGWAAGDGEPRAVLEVEDDGPGMPADVADRVFERFYRADPSRSRASGGSGLGLAIVHAIVESHDGTVVLHTAPGSGTLVRVELPAVLDRDDPDALEPGDPAALEPGDPAALEPGDPAALEPGDPAAPPEGEGGGDADAAETAERPVT